MLCSRTPLRIPFATAATLLAAGPLFAQTPELAPVVVTASRQATRLNEVLADVTVVDREELQTAGHSTLVEILSRQPGVEIAANGGPGANSTVYLRGGANPKHTLVLIDGQRAGSATSGDFAWSRLTADQIERIEILRGGASSLYGSDAIGGVIQIFTRQGDGPMRLNGEFGQGRYNTRSGSLGLSGSANGFRYTFQASGMNTNGYNFMTNNQNRIYGDRDGFHNQSVTANLGYRFNPDHDIALNLFNSLGDNRYDSTSATQATVSKDYHNNQEIGSYALVSTNRLNAQWTSTVRLGRGVDSARNYTNGTLSSVFKTHQDQTQWQNDFDTGLGRFLVALERLEQKVFTLTSYTQTQRTVDSALLGWSGNHDRHSWQTNLRRDENSQFGGKTTGGLSYGYQIQSQWRLSGSYGSAFKAPTMNDLYYPLTGGFVGNPNLKSETSHNREATLSYRGNGQYGSLTAFSNRINDLISWSGVTSPINIGHAKISGETLAGGLTRGNLDLQASLTHQDATDEASGRRLARRAKLYGTASAGYRLAQWEMRAELQGADQRYDTDANTRAMGGYTVLNLYVSRAIDRDWSAFARLNNALGKRYELAADFATPGANLFVGVRYSPK